MKDGQIFARKSTARGNLDLEYLDETSRQKVSLRERADLNEQIGRKLKGFTDYASKESLGQAHAGGFLHDLVRRNPDGSSTAPNRLSNEERKRRITGTWSAHLARSPSRAKRPVIAHRMDFSMSVAQHDALVSAGINPDQVLHSTMRKIMRRFAEKFHPGDSIGFAYGLHHDTGNLHAHVALCPRTAKGRYVGCSTSRVKDARHKKQMDQICAWFARENARWTKILSSPEQIEHTIAKRLDGDRLVFSRKLNQRQLIALRSAQNSDAQRLQQIHQSIGRLERSIELERAALAAQVNLRRLGRFVPCRTSKIQREAEKVVATVQRDSLRDQQRQLLKLKRQYLGLHKRYSRLYGFTSHAHRHAQQPNIAQRTSNRL